LLCLPTIADKSFLITIGDRSVGGMISRDQMVGPWQVPVADVAVSLNSYDGHGGEAMAMGERSPVAVLNAPASGRLAVAEAITNILAADIQSLNDIACPRIGWRPAASRARMPTCMPRCARWAWSCVHRWGSPSRSARIRCP